MYRFRYGEAGTARRAARAWAFALVGLLLALLPAHAGPTKLQGVVVRVIDGDTVHVRLPGGVEKVRYIGVNSPELRHPERGEEPGGRAAAAANRRLVADRHVRLVLDVQERDRHGRLLAYVYVDRAMVNAEMVRLGYAQVMTVPPNVRHQPLFLDLERQARAARRGLWRDAPTAAAGIRSDASVAAAAIRGEASSAAPGLRVDLPGAESR